MVDLNKRTVISNAVQMAAMQKAPPAPSTYSFNIDPAGIAGIAYSTSLATTVVSVPATVASTSPVTAVPTVPTVPVTETVSVPTAETSNTFLYIGIASVILFLVLIILYLVMKH